MKLFSLLIAIILLKSCTDANNQIVSDNGKEEPVENSIETPKGNFKTGVYHAYQLSSAGYGFQYKFEIKEGGEYIMFDKKGTYEYEPSTNVIKFLTGGLKEFYGVFTRVDHVNESRKLMIVLDFNGGVPDTLNLGKKPGGYYQYAYIQE